MSIGEDPWVCKRNIDRFKALLAEAQSDYDRGILRDLLAREEQTLSRLAQAKNAGDPGGKKLYDFTNS